MNKKKNSFSFRLKSKQNRFLYYSEMCAPKCNTHIHIQIIVFIFLYFQCLILPLMGRNQKEIKLMKDEYIIIVHKNLLKTVYSAITSYVYIISVTRQNKNEKLWNIITWRSFYLTLRFNSAVRIRKKTYFWGCNCQARKCM